MDRRHVKNNHSDSVAVSTQETYALGVILNEHEDRHFLRILAHAVQHECPLFAVRQDGSGLHAIGFDDELREIRLDTNSFVADAETAKRAAEAGAVVAEHPENRGYGAALRTLFEARKRRNASNRVVLDADGTRYTPRMRT